MSQEITIPNTEVSFKDFLFKNKRNRTILWLAAAAIIIQWAVFKYFYPFASYIHDDSFSYLIAAYKNLSINTYMVGYSKFLRLFSVFSNSDYILVAFQYLLLQVSSLFLLFTLFYYYPFTKGVQILLITFFVCNPLLLHLANMISSDGFFLSMSMIWLALLMWIIQRPSVKIILWHGLIILICFMTRYNAMIYPLISVLAFWMSNLKSRNKILGAGYAFVLCSLFAILTMHEYNRLTGTWQYSPFSGWQLANNAMYAYRYVNINDRKPVPQKFRQIDYMVREFFDSTRDIKRFPSEEVMASTFYMWSRSMPLMKYRDKLFLKNKDTSASELKKWASMGPFFKEYGFTLIKQYPLHFIKYFVWPNANKYYAPPIEFLQNYNSGKNSVPSYVAQWFRYKDTKLKARGGNYIWSLNFYPILSGIINVVMLFSLLCFAILKGFKQNDFLMKSVTLGCALWLTNAGFTIFASSAALRFQSFPILVTTIYSITIVYWISQHSNSLNKKRPVHLVEQEKLQPNLT